MKKNKIIIIIGIINLLIGLITIPKSYFDLSPLINIRSYFDSIIITTSIWNYIAIFVFMPLKILIIPAARCITGYGLSLLKSWSRKSALLIASLSLVTNLSIVIRTLIHASNNAGYYIAQDFTRGVFRKLTFTSAYFVIAFDVIVIIYLMLPKIKKRFIQIKKNNESIKLMAVINNIKSKLNPKIIFKAFLYLISSLILIIILFISFRLLVINLKQKMNKKDIEKFVKLYSSQGDPSEFFNSSYIYFGHIPIQGKKNYYMTAEFYSALNPKESKLTFGLYYRENKDKEDEQKDKISFVRKLKDKYLREKITFKEFSKYQWSFDLYLLTPYAKLKEIKEFSNGVDKIDKSNRKIIKKYNINVKEDIKIVFVGLSPSFKGNEYLLLFVSLPIRRNGEVLYAAGSPGPYLSIMCYKYDKGEGDFDLIKTYTPEFSGKILRAWMRRPDALWPGNKGIHLKDLNNDWSPELIITSIYAGATGCGASALIIINFKDGFNVMLEKIGAFGIEDIDNDNVYEVKVCSYDDKGEQIVEIYKYDKDTDKFVK